MRVDVGYGNFSPVFAPDRRYVFVAGGVGLTPVYSILKDLHTSNDSAEVVLVYTVHNESEILFRDELESWFGLRDDWKLHIACTRQIDWPGPTGRLSSDMLDELLAGDLSGTFFLCGPLGLLSAVGRHLHAE